MKSCSKKKLRVDALMASQKHTFVPAVFILHQHLPTRPEGAVLREGPYTQRRTPGAYTSIDPKESQKEQGWTST
jgi:hypothetical protein